MLSPDRAPPMTLTQPSRGQTPTTTRKLGLSGVNGLGQGGTGYARQASASVWQVTWHSTARAESVTAATQEQRPDSASPERGCGHRQGHLPGQARTATWHLSSRKGVHAPWTRSTGTFIRNPHLQSAPLHAWAPLPQEDPAWKHNAQVCEHLTDY